MYEMKITSRGKNKGNIIFRDSFNLMPMSLASLVPAFALQVEDKPYFPHLANHPNNYGKEIFPTKADYLADGMLPEKGSNLTNGSININKSLSNLMRL
uniref:Uncharacterized protein n=1 Tax=Meloidogyne enterolobii TaxID=390850 RepID=A0A6V7U1V0_MELEN|nr:unnamed protein product [Meloidogyne enterolobii]